MRPQPAPADPSYALAPSVHAVAVAEDLVFLDIAADAYSCVAYGASTAVLDRDRRVLVTGDAALAGALLAAGLIAAGPPAAATLPSHPLAPARCTAIGTLLPPPGRTDLADAVRGVTDLLLAYRGREFSDLLGCAARRTGAAPEDLSPELLILVARFRRWVPYAPVSGKCLLRSFLLLRLLRRHGFDARWVFGVGTWPFAAHCWLQIGDTVLDDEVDRLAPYRPILVV